MEFDPSWDTLLKPGRAKAYFDRSPLPPLRLPGAGFSPATAWWLAELSRLAYRSEDAVPGRAAILEAVGLCETETVDVDGIHGFLVTAQGGRAEGLGILVFRGTIQFRNWVTNLRALPASWRAGGRVHRGFRRAMTRAWRKVATALEPVSEPLIYTGHSLGAALATLAASLQPPHALYTFGSPRVGDRGFAESLSGVGIHRVVNQHDLVPTLPPEGGPRGFRHVGAECHLVPGRDCRADTVESAGTFSVLSALTRAGRQRAAPRSLADHAPANYVAALERLL